MALRFAARGSVLIGVGLLAWASIALAKMPQLEIATEDLPPFSMMKEGKLTGLSSEIIRVALQRADISYRISIFPWIRAYRMATTQPDLCLYSTVRTAEREPIFKWVGPLVRDKWVVFVPADSPIEIASIEDLKRYRTASLPDDAITQFLQENGIPFDRSVTTESIRMLEGGRIDYWATTLLKGRYQANLDGIKLRMALVIKDEDMYLACNKAVPDRVVAALNDAIARMDRDGTIARLSKPYQ
jgi:polar amino acid transport system substrate-binding protein